MKNIAKIKPIENHHFINKNKYKIIMKIKKMTLRHLSKDILIVVGLVLIWRGIWYVLDNMDILFFGGKHLWTAVGGIIVGLLMLYLPDKDLKEIEKL